MSKSFFQNNLYAYPSGQCSFLLHGLWFHQSIQSMSLWGRVIPFLGLFLCNFRYCIFAVYNLFYISLWPTLLKTNLRHTGGNLSSYKYFTILHWPISICLIYVQQSSLDPQMISCSKAARKIWRRDAFCSAWCVKCLTITGGALYIVSLRPKSVGKDG
jgi:hypothetical protein